MGSKFEEVLGPGCHRFHVKKERIVVVDLRNYPIIVERFCYPDIAGKNSWISISAMIRVSDAHLAVTQCNNHVNEAVAAIGNVLRGYLPTRAALELRRERKACEQKISALLTAPLEKIGVMLSSFEITEVSSPVKDVVGTLAGVH